MQGKLKFPGVRRIKLVRIPIFSEAESLWSKIRLSQVLKNSEPSGKEVRPRYVGPIDAGTRDYTGGEFACVTDHRNHYVTDAFGIRPPEAFHMHYSGASESRPGSIPVLVIGAHTYDIIPACVIWLLTPVYRGSKMRQGAKKTKPIHTYISMSSTDNISSGQPRRVSSPFSSGRLFTLTLR